MSCFFLVGILADPFRSATRKTRGGRGRRWRGRVWSGFPSFRDCVALGSQVLGFVGFTGFVFGIFQVFGIGFVEVSDFSGLQFFGIVGKALGFVVCSCWRSSGSCFLRSSEC